MYKDENKKIRLYTLFVNMHSLNAMDLPVLGLETEIVISSPIFAGNRHSIVRDIVTPGRCSLSAKIIIAVVISSARVDIQPPWRNPK